jgi:hypothetical protein
MVIAADNLLYNIFQNERLTLWVFTAIPMTAVNHE